MQVSKEIWTWGEDQKMQIHRMQKGNQKDQNEKKKKKVRLNPPIQGTTTTRVESNGKENKSKRGL